LQIRISLNDINTRYNIYLSTNQFVDKLSALVTEKLIFWVVVILIAKGLELN